MGQAKTGRNGRNREESGEFAYWPLQFHHLLEKKIDFCPEDVQNTSENVMLIFFSLYLGTGEHWSSFYRF